MNMQEFKIFKDQNNSNLKFDFSLKNLNWMNIGGSAKVFFKPENLKELISFLKIVPKYKKHVLGAGSNLLISEKLGEKIFIKLGKNFSNISLIDDNKLIAGCSSLDKNVSDFACENGLSGLEFLSCIPGSVGGGIRMNSGCFGSEFKDFLVSIQVVDFEGRVSSIRAKDIIFDYRECNLPYDLIFLSATFECKKSNKELIRKEIERLKKLKESSQPLRIKTGGSTFKNPVKSTERKVWELIRESVPEDISFGDAKISSKHSNFFVNSKNASFSEMNKLINYVRDEVKKKTGISLDLEIEIIE